MQIYSYIKWLKTNDEENFIIHLVIVISSIIMTLTFGFSVSSQTSIIGWDAIEYVIFSLASLGINIFSLVITVIIYLIRFYKGIKINPGFNRKKIISFALILYIIFISVFILEITPYYIKVINNMADSNGASKEVISYLNKHMEMVLK